MHNQHAGLSPTLAEQHRTGLHEQASRQRLLAAARRPRRRTWSPRRRWLLDGQPSPQTSLTSLAPRRPTGGTMFKLAGALALGALLATVNLASMTAVAHATDHTGVTQDGRRPPAEGQVGEAWRLVDPRGRPLPRGAPPLARCRPRSGPVNRT